MLQKVLSPEFANSSLVLNWPILEASSVLLSFPLAEHVHLTMLAKAYPVTRFASQNSRNRVAESAEFSRHVRGRGDESVTAERTARNKREPFKRSRINTEWEESSEEDQN